MMAISAMFVCQGATDQPTVVAGAGVVAAAAAVCGERRLADRRGARYRACGQAAMFSPQNISMTAAMTNSATAATMSQPKTDQRIRERRVTSHACART